MEAVAHDRARWVANELLPHEPGLRAWLSRRVRPPLEVDDIVQETYAVLGGLQSVEHIRSPRNYMFQTAHSLVFAQIRRANVIHFESLVEFESMDISNDYPSPEDDVVARNELRRVKALIDSLPVRQREAFTLFKVEGLTQREIARCMGVSQKTVEKHLAKAISVLIVAIGRGGKAFRKTSISLDASQLAKRSRAPDEFTD